MFCEKTVKNPVPVHRWGKGKEELDTGVILYDYSTYIQKSSTGKTKVHTRRLGRFASPVHVLLQHQERPLLLGQRCDQLAAEGGYVRDHASPDQVAFAEGWFVHPGRSGVLEIVLYTEGARGVHALDDAR
jgi:hypothetical protein